jgi:hypothetical protein
MRMRHLRRYLWGYVESMVVMTADLMGDVVEAADHGLESLDCCGVGPLRARARCDWESPDTGLVLNLNPPLQSTTPYPAGQQRTQTRSRSGADGPDLHCCQRLRGCDRRHRAIILQSGPASAC